MSNTPAVTARLQRFHADDSTTKYDLIDLGVALSKAINKGRAQGDDPRVIDMLEGILSNWDASNHAADPEPGNDLRFGPGDDAGADWAESEHYISDDEVLGTAEAAELLATSKVRLTRWIAANLAVLAKRQVLTQYAAEAIVVRVKGRDPLDTDNAAIYDLRGL